MELVRYIMNYENCSLRYKPLSPKPLEDEHPKIRGHVERANRRHREEFYEVEEVDLSPEEHNRQLERWEAVFYIEFINSR